MRAHLSHADSAALPGKALVAKAPAKRRTPRKSVIDPIPG